MGNILRKRKLKTKKVPRNLEEFKKWETILPELRKHAITYFDGETQFNYAQCSKVCRDEIQNMDNKTPLILKMGSLDEECTDMFIHVYFCNPQKRRVYGYEMKFINVENNKHKWIVRPYSEYRETLSTRVFQTDENAIYSGTAMEGILRYVDHRIRFSIPHVEPISFELITDSWPNQLSNVLRLFHKDHWVIGQFIVHLNHQIYDSFMKFMEDSPISSNIAPKCGRARDSFILPPSFFDSNLFRNAETFACTTRIITDEQFLQTRARDLTLRTTNITSEAVHQKLLNWFNDVTSVPNSSFLIGGLVRDPDHWNRQTVIGDLPFRQQDDDTYIIQKGGITMKLLFRNIIRTVLIFEPYDTESDTDDE